MAGLKCASYLDDIHTLQPPNHNLTPSGGVEGNRSICVIWKMGWGHLRHSERAQETTYS